MTLHTESPNPDFTEIDNCPVCGHGDIEDYMRMPYCASDVEEYLFGYYAESGAMNRKEYAKFFHGQFYTLSKCKRCTAAFQRNRPGPNVSDLVYNHWIPERRSGVLASAKLTLKDVQHYMSEAVKLISLSMRSTGIDALPRVRVLDHGMGNGFFCLALKACFVEVWGTEFASGRIEFGRQNSIKTLNVSDELPENYFHLINTEQVMEHVPDPRQTIARLVKSLTKGGILKISVPNSYSIEKGDMTIDWRASRYARRSPMPLAPLEHLQYYSRNCRRIIAEDHGLDLVELPRSYHLQYGNNWSVRGSVRNIGRLLFLNSMRNYFLLRKS